MQSVNKSFWVITFCYFMHPSVSADEGLCNPSRTIAGQFNSGAGFHYRAYDPAEINLPQFSEKQTTLTRVNFLNAHNTSGHAINFFGFSHKYKAFDFGETQQSALQTNGHLHQLMARWYLSSKEGRRQWTFGLAPLLSVSSNQLKKVDRINRDSWQLHGFFEYRIALDKQSHWFFGACIDDRFDHLKLYPLLGVSGSLNNQLDFKLAYPDSSIGIKIAPRWRFTASVSPAGNKWEVYNEALARHSLFQYRGWQGKLTLFWQPEKDWRLSAEFGKEFQRRFKFSQVVTDRRVVDAESAEYLAINIAWYW